MADEDDAMRLLGQRIKEARKRANYTQIELGEMLGVAKQTISNWETGAAPPMLTNIVKLTSVLNIDTAELFTGLSEDLTSSDVKRRMSATSRLLPLYGLDTAGGHPDGTNRRQ